MSFNKTILMGRLTADVELRDTASGHQVANFSIAVDRGYGDDKKTDFFPIVAWNGTAETIARCFKKGNQIIVSGSLQNRQWEDNKGSKHTTTELVATEFAFCETKKDSSAHSSTGGRNAEKRGNNASTRKPTLQAMDDDSDIPF